MAQGWIIKKSTAVGQVDSLTLLSSYHGDEKEYENTMDANVYIDIIIPHV